MHLSWDISFEAKTINGWCRHTIKILDADCEEVCFDSSKLLIKKTTLNATEVVIRCAELNPVLGTQICVPIPTHLQKKDAEFDIVFYYTVTSEATALQFLEPAATAGKKHPYMFTQCQVGNIYLK